MLSILYGLASAISWGAGDFTGGLAARKVGAYRSVLYGEVIGVLVLFLAVGFADESFPDSRTWLIATLAGMLGSVGLLLLYHSMTLGLMSISAPVSALLAAVFPVVAGLFTQALPEFPTVIGFSFALVAVWMISQGKGGIHDILSHLADLKLPLLAGIGFGSYFVLMHEATKTGLTVWPMIASRCGGMALLVAYMLISHSTWKVDSSAWPIISANGILDLGGNFFFILASQAGRLDVSAVLSSLFPGATVLLAWIFLKERLNRNQWLGIAAALIAIVLMTI